MPHDQYMQTAEGKQSQKAFSDWGNWVSQPSGGINSSSPYAPPQPGQGGIPSDAIFRKNSQQPAAPQTKQSGSMDLSAYAPGKAQPTQTPSLGSAYSPSDQGLVWNQTEQAYLPPAQQPTQRPAPQQPAMQQPTSMQAGVYGPGGEYYGANQSQGLADAMRQRDAFVQQSMQAMLPYQVANFTKQDFGQPQFDLQGMRNAASQMAQDGFYNPFTQYFQQQQQTMAPEFLNPYAPPSLYGNPYFMPQTNPYFMQPPPMFGGPMMPPTAPPMQADPYQQWLSSLPGYQPRDQWMTKQPQASPPPSQQAPVSKSPNDRTGMTYVPAEYRDGKLWSDAHYVNNAPPIPEYAPGGMDPIPRPGQAGIPADAIFRKAQPGQAQPIQPPSQGTPYGGKLVDIDKDGVDDRQQYGSPQEAMAARDRGTARVAAAQKLGFQSADQIDIASTLLNTGGARDKSRDFYGVQVLDSPLSYTQRADRLVERLGLLENAGATITPAERAAAESLAAVLRNPANASLNMGTPSQAGQLALFNSRLSQAEQSLRSATEEGNRWRELSGYEKQWGGPTTTPPPAAPVDRSQLANYKARLSRDEQAQLDAAQATMWAYQAKMGSRGGGYDQISMADREAATPERYNAAIQTLNELKDKGGKLVAADPAAQEYIRERDAQNAASIQLQREASARADAMFAKEREKRLRAEQQLAAEGFVRTPAGLTTADPSRKAALTTALAARMRTGGQLSPNEREFLQTSLGYDINAHTVKRL